MTSRGVDVVVVAPGPAADPGAVVVVVPPALPLPWSRVCSNGACWIWATARGAYSATDGGGGWRAVSDTAATTASTTATTAPCTDAGTRVERGGSPGSATTSGSTSLIARTP